MHCRSCKRDCVGNVSMRGSLLFTGGRFCLRFCLHKLSLPCGASSRIKQLCEYLSVLKVLSSEHTPPAFGTNRLQDRKAESSAVSVPQPLSPFCGSFFPLLSSGQTFGALRREKPCFPGVFHALPAQCVLSVSPVCTGQSWVGTFAAPPAVPVPAHQLIRPSSF